jgi:hypothetical protein
MGLGPNRPIFVVKTRSTGRLPGPIANPTGVSSVHPAIVPAEAPVAYLEGADSCQKEANAIPPP